MRLTIGALGVIVLVQACGPSLVEDPDAGTAPTCAHMPPAVADTPEAMALATAAARCGQTAHGWRDDPTLGTIVTTRVVSRFSASSLLDLASSQGITLPEAPRHDTSLTSVTYVTQDRGELVEATALVAWPRDLPEGTPDPDLILLLHGSSGYADGCGPTRDLGSQVLAAMLASLGWMVVAPDYLGMRGDGETTGFPNPYLVGQPTAIASLDAARAAIAMAPASRGGLCSSGRVLVLGGSQGGHAALWTERLAPYYAGELPIVGTVATVPPADLVGQVERALTSLVPATESSIVFFGTAPLWYGAGDRLSEAFVSPLDAQITEMITAECDPSGPLDPATLEEVFAAPLLDAAARGEIESYGELGCMVAENGLTTTSIARIGPSDPSYAILFVLGGSDTLVDPVLERASASALCEQGAPVQFVECSGAEHIEGTLWALPEIIDFARARFAGEIPDPGTLCSIGASVRCRGTPATAP